jgi:hypothetical protein
MLVAMGCYGTAGGHGEPTKATGEPHQLKTLEQEYTPLEEDKSVII